MKKLFIAFLLPLTFFILFNTNVSAAATGLNLYYDDEFTGPVNIGFDFTFYGTTYSQVYVSTNGLITFGSGSSEYSNRPIPTTGGANNFIAAFWDDLIPHPNDGEGGPKRILYETIGNSPNRKFVVQWTGVYFYGSDIQLGTFQTILYETSNKIEFQYPTLLGDARSFGNSASIGIENIDATLGVQYSYNETNAIQEGQCISFTRVNSTTYTINENDESCSSITSQVEGAPSAATPMTPTNSATSVSLTPTFEWQAGNLVDTYVLYISKNPTFSGIEYSESGIEGTSSTIQNDQALDYETTYYWKIESVNETGSILSPTFSFTTVPDIQPPNSPSNFGPANLIHGGYSVVNQPTFTFQITDPNVNDSVSFRIRVFEYGSVTPIINYNSPLGEEGARSFTVGQAEGGGHYYTGSEGQILEEGEYEWELWAYDATNQESNTSYASNSNEGVDFTVDTIPPQISEVTSSSTENSATIEWKTDENSSSYLNYGLTTSYSNITSEINTSPRVTSHEVNISNLVPCSKYLYRAGSKDAAGNTATYVGTVTTSGCTAASPVEEDNTDFILDEEGGNVQLKDLSDKGILLSIPIGFANTDASFQIHKLNKTTVITTILEPVGVIAAGSYIYELRALDTIDNAITTFDNPITITITYSTEDIRGINEASLNIYRWDGSAWNVLSDCTVDTTLKTVTCTTTQFSTFGLFGQTAANSNYQDRWNSGGGTKTLTEGSIFNDINGTTFESHIENLAKASIIGGYTDGSYRPQDYLTRGQLSKFIVNAFDFEIQKTTSKFPDIKEDNTFFDYINTLANLGIISGYPDGTFRPNKYVTRAEASKIITKGLQSKGISIVYNDQNKFGDVDNNHTLYNYISFLADKKIVNGYSDGTFKPDVFLTRGQMAKIVYNSQRLK